METSTRKPGSVITLATVHLAKIPGAIRTATGLEPEMPEELDHLLNRREGIVDGPKDPALTREVVRRTTRAGS